MPFSLSPVRLGVALLSGALATGIFHLAQKGEGTSAIAAALGVPEPAAVVAPKAVPQGAAKSAAAGWVGSGPVVDQPKAAGPVADQPKAAGIRGTATKGLKAATPGRTVPRSARVASTRGTAPGAAKPASGRGAAPGTLAVTKAPKRIVFRHNSPGVIVLTLQGDQLDVEFKEGR